MITPIMIDYSPEICPECGRPEHIIEVCKHCGYEYSTNDELSFTTFCIGFLIVVCVLILGIWAASTTFDWLCGYENKSLVDILQNQWNWVRNLRIL